MRKIVEYTLMPIAAALSIIMVFVAIVKSDFVIDEGCRRFEKSIYGDPIQIVLPDRIEEISVYELDDIQTENTTHSIFSPNYEIEHNVNMTALYNYAYSHLYKKNENASIELDDSGRYCIEEGSRHSEFDIDKAVEFIADQLRRNKTKIDLRHICKYNEDIDKTTYDLYDRIKWINDTELSAKEDRKDNSEERTVDIDLRDYNFDIEENMSAVELEQEYYNYIRWSLIEKIQDMLGTSQDTLEFSQDWGILEEDETIPYVTYGSDFDFEGIANRVGNLLQDKQPGHHTFNVKVSGHGTVIEDNVDDMIVVSLADQELRRYNVSWQDGNIVHSRVETSAPVVTGKIGKHDTPVGVFAISDKKQNKILRGEGYASFVHYWMRLTPQGVGLHDASWRSDFGGDIYKTNGSHGCINLPADFAESLYNSVDVGQCVIVAHSSFID